MMFTSSLALLYSLWGHRSTVSMGLRGAIIYEQELTQTVGGKRQRDLPKVAVVTDGTPCAHGSLGQDHTHPA